MSPAERTPFQQAADLLVVGLPGPTLDPEDRRVLQSVHPGGIILLPRNIEDAEQLRELVRELRDLVPEAFLYLDAEGGPVDRLREVIGPAPSAAALAKGPESWAERSGRWIGQGLRAFDFDVDYAPVVDLDRGQVRNALDARYWGNGPRAVTTRAQAFLRGLHGAGIGGCLKHFPGLGAAQADTHFEGARVALDLEDLDPDLAPFAALGELAGSVMVGHASYPRLDGSDRPATLSKKILEGLLRRRLRFRGLAFSDDLEMLALAAWGDLEERAEASLRAGCDVLLLCQTLAAAEPVAGRLAAPELADRRRQAGARLLAYRRDVLARRRRAPRFSVAVVRDRLARLGEAVDA